ncbi:MAG: PKD domain-containing protein [Saprospiraceae bacterium]
MATPMQGCVPLEVDFQDLSVATSAPITHWTWGLGGNCNVVEATTGAPQSCSYDLPDNYAISLTVTDANGCSQTESKADYLKVSPKPIIEVELTGDFACAPPATVGFTNAGPTTGITYEWDFGNGESYTGDFPPNILYNDYGSYDITIIATDTSSNCSDILILEDYVQVGNIVDIAFTPTEGCAALLVEFTDTSPLPADSVVWEFGDGFTSTDANPSYVYQNPGCYYVRLKRFQDGCVSEKFASNCILVQPKPVANYSNDNNIGCSLPHIVNFTSLTLNAVSWHWDFGDGESSNAPNPTHAFNAYGEFPVSLVTENALGCKDTVVVNTIKVEAVQASLLNPFLTGCSPLEVNFADNSTSITPIIAWEWEIVTPNETYQSTQSTPSFSIVDTGFFDLRLIVTNTLGCTDTTTFEQVIQVGADPLVNFIADPTLACVEIPINFTDLSADYVEEWFWDFGDGTFGFEQNPTHLYTDTGYYDITLLVNHNGCNGVLNLENYVHVIDPVAKFSIQQFCQDPFRRQFKDKSIGAETILWDFGIPGITTDTSSLAEPEFTFPATGVYSVKLTAYNANTGCFHTETKNVYITVPVADFVLDTLRGCAPLSLQVGNQSEFGDKYYWSGSDANFSDVNAVNPTIVFATPGIHTDLQLIIKDINNCRDTLQFQDTILVNGIEIDFVATPSGGCLPLTVEFADTSTDLFANIISYNWIFGNNLGSSSAAQPSFEFDAVGLFPVRLQLTDDWGCTNELAIPEVVEVTKPVIKFNAKQESCTDQCVQFQNSSEGKNLSYFWDFGDGETSNLKKPLHCFANEGVYTICLTVTDAYGCEETLCKSDYITIANPVANFSVDVTGGTCPPLNVPFTNLSQNATAFSWDFGNGSSTLVDPTQIYTEPGQYAVRLIATSVPGCSDTLTLDNLINLEGPVGSFTMDQDTICRGESVSFVAQSAAAYFYVWDSGNGILDTAGLQSADTVSWTYETIGTYFPSLILTDGQGCQRIVAAPSELYVAGLALDFAATDTLFCDVNEVVTFINLSSASETIETFQWDFENGNPSQSTAIQPAVSFTGTGKYDVQLIATTALCSDTILKEDLIRIGPNPTAAFQLSTVEGCAPLSVDFTATATTPTGTIEDWHWDFGDGTTTSIPNPSHTFTAGGNIPIALTVTTDIGCSNTATEFVTAYGLTALSAGVAPEICIGEAAQLNATISGDTTGTNYYWTPATNLSCINCMNPKASPTVTTIYTFIVENAEGCSSSSEVTVFVKPDAIPEISLTKDTTVCLNSFVQLYASGGEDVYAYQWEETREGLNCYEACLNPIATPTVPTTYVLTVTNSNGCAAIDSVFVNVSDESQSFAGADKTICAGESTPLSLSITNDPHWLVYDGLSCVYCADPVASPSETTNYEVQAYTDNGCLIKDSIQIRVIARDAISAGQDTTICLGDLVTLNGRGEGVITWEPANTLDDPTILQPEALPETNTQYKIRMVNGECTLEDSVQVNLLQSVQIRTEDFVICQQDSVQLFASGTATDYQWTNLETGERLLGNSPFVAPSKTTAYQVIGRRSTCYADTAQLTVVVNKLPASRLPMVHYYFSGQQVYLDLSYGVTERLEYQWEYSPGLSCLRCPDPVIDPTVATETLTATLTNATTGCQQSIETRLEELNTCPGYLASVPNAFSPNGDGINDLLLVQTAQSIETLKLFQIYDRWGNLVFSTNNLTQGWDGRYQGKNLANGVYVYFVELVCPVDGSSFSVQGDVSLLR